MNCLKKNRNKNNTDTENQKETTEILRRVMISSYKAFFHTQDISKAKEAQETAAHPFEDVMYFFLLFPC